MDLPLPTTHHVCRLAMKEPAMPGNEDFFDIPLSP
jgi:hypothetical protein